MTNPKKKIECSHPEEKRTIEVKRCGQKSDKVTIICKECGKTRFLIIDYLDKNTIKETTIIDFK